MNDDETKAYIRAYMATPEFRADLLRRQAERNREAWARWWKEFHEDNLKEDDE